MSSNVRNQSLRSIIVRICNGENEETVGTGFLVSLDGKIVTCAHVWRDAVRFSDGRLGTEVLISLPQIENTTAKQEKWRAELVAQLPQEYHDDVVLLRVVNPPYLREEQIAILGDATASVGNEFKTFGYKKLGAYESGYADGKIIGITESPFERNLRYEPLQLKSNGINKGMSGSPILDEDRNLIVGIVSETWYPDHSMKDRDTAWAVNAGILAEFPFQLKIRKNSLPLKAAPSPKPLNVTQPQTPASTLFIDDAPPPVTEWVGREELLQRLNDDWVDQSLRVSGLIGFGGEGKSSLVRKWLTNVFKGRLTPRPEGIFWWNFYAASSVKAFLNAMMAFVTGDDNNQIKSMKEQVHYIATLLQRKRFLFILDGMEVVQYQHGEKFGLAFSPELTEILQFLASPHHQSHSVITSRVPVIDLIDYKTYVHRDVNRLTLNEGRTLLQMIGVHGDVSSVEQMVSDWDGHALTLSLLGSYLVEFHEGKIESRSAIQAPTVEETRYDRVHRVLDRYDKHLNESERFFLTVMSNDFRRPISKEELIPLFRTRSGIYVQARASGQNHRQLSDGQLELIIKRLVSYRLLGFETKREIFTSHALVRLHYLIKLGGYVELLTPDDNWELTRILHGIRLVVIAIDASWSMAVAERMEQTRSLVESIAAYSLKLDKTVGLISFNKNDASLLLSPSSSLELLYEQLSQLEIGGKSPLSAGMQLAFDVIERELVPKSAALLILLSDGAGNVSIGDLPPQQEAHQIAQKIRQAGIQSIVLNMEHAAFDQGLAKLLAENLGGQCFDLFEVITTQARLYDIDNIKDKRGERENNKKQERNWWERPS